MASFDDFLGKDGGADAVKKGSKNPGLDVGVYQAKINRCVAGEARAGWFYLVAEMEVQTSNNDKFPKGTIVSHYIGFDKDIELKKRQLLEFLMGAGGLSEEEAKAAWKKGSVWGTDQLFADQTINIVVTLSATPAKKSGKHYRMFRFTPSGD